MRPRTQRGSGGKEGDAAVFERLSLCPRRHDIAYLILLKCGDGTRAGVPDVVLS